MEESFTLFNPRPKPLEETFSPLYISILVDMCRSDEGLFRLIGFLDCRLLAQLDQWEGCPDWCRLELAADIHSLLVESDAPDIAVKIQNLLNRPRWYQRVQTRVELTLACWKIKTDAADGEEWGAGNLKHVQSARSACLTCCGSNVVARSVLPYLFRCKNKTG